MSTLASEASSTVDSANRAKRLLMKRKMQDAEKKVSCLNFLPVVYNPLIYFILYSLTIPTACIFINSTNMCIEIDTSFERKGIVA